MSTAMPQPPDFHRSRAARLALVTGMTLLTLAGCASFTGIAGPKAQTLNAQTLGLNAPTPAATSTPQLTTAPLEIDTAWWQALGSTQLNHLVELALSQQPSLKVVQARLERLQALAAGADSTLKPQIHAGADLTRQRYSANGLFPPPIAGAVMDSGSVQLASTWELDVFGKNRSALDAAVGQVRAAEADAQAARRLLASQVVRSYLQLARIQAHTAVAQQVLEQRTQMLRLVQDRVNAGIDTQLELEQANSSLPDARLELEVLHEQKELAQHALATLIAQPIDTFTLDAFDFPAIKNIVTIDSVPADLLGRRADIAAARWRIEAATQDVANAKSQFYPNINISAFAGLSSLGFDKLFKSGSEQWGVGPAIRLPLFDAGHLRANLRGKTAELDANIETYNALVIEAVRDVADQISSSRAIARQQTEQSAAQISAEAAYAIARQRYEAGLGNYLNVLSAETAVLAQRRRAVDLSSRALDTQVQLVRALGGGYSAANTPSEAPATASLPTSTQP